MRRSSALKSLTVSEQIGLLPIGKWLSIGLFGNSWATQGIVPFSGFLHVLSPQRPGLLIELHSGNFLGPQHLPHPAHRAAENFRRFVDRHQIANNG